MKQSVLRFLTKIVGIVLIITGLVGLLLGDQPIFGVLNIDVAEDIIHLVTGLALTYWGFRSPEPQLRLFVGSLGVVSLLAGIIGFFLPTLLGLVPHGYTIADNLLHLGLGVLAVLFAWVIKVPGETAPPATPGTAAPA
jgi:hypothetical protein